MVERKFVGGLTLDIAIHGYMYDCAWRDRGSSELGLAALGAFEHPTRLAAGSHGLRRLSWAQL